MKQICLHFHVHQPDHLNRFHFFDIGHTHSYFNEGENERNLKQLVKNCYLPTNTLLLKLLKKHKGNFKVSFSLSGSVLKQFQQWAPEVIDSFKKLFDTGLVELLAETSNHSLSSVYEKSLFQQEVREHANLLKSLFGIKPTAFCNTELIYSDEIGEWIKEMGYAIILTEGTKSILKWKSPNFLYQGTQNDAPYLLLRNYKLSADIAFRFSNTKWNEYPLTPEKYVKWIDRSEPNAEVINLFMDYETFGANHQKESGIFLFLDQFPSEAINEGIGFTTPSDILKEFHTPTKITAPKLISWDEKAHDISAWLENPLQQDAFQKLYTLKPKIKNTDKTLADAFNRLQQSDHFYYMSTKESSEANAPKRKNPYSSPFDAYINYMNVLNDLEEQLNKSS